MRPLLIALALFFIFACSQVKEPTFSLIGTTQGITDGTPLKLMGSSDNTSLDSTTIQNNQFAFHTILPQTPILVTLITGDFSQYRFLWLENTAMTFDATNTDFRHAKVQGSGLEDLSQKYIRGIDSIPPHEKAKRTIFEIQFVEKHNNSILSAYMLAGYCKAWGKEVSQRLYDQFPTEIQVSTYGQTISKYLLLNKNPQIGEKYVDFEMETPKGDFARLSDLQGKVVLLEFWASNCRPCRIENPNLVKTYQKYNSLGFEVFAVSQDTKRSSWLKAIEKDGLPWIQTSDLKGIANAPSLIYGVKGIPDNFLIDKNGTLIDRNLRGESLNQRLEELLGKE